MQPFVVETDAYQPIGFCNRIQRVWARDKSIYEKKLIVVTKLLDENNCIVQITNTLCVIQDRVTRQLIGVGEREDGLFFFRGVPKASCWWWEINGIVAKAVRTSVGESTLEGS